MSPTRSVIFLILTILTYTVESQTIFKDASKSKDAKKKGTNWAILVAGSKGYWNFRHQADICHAYQVLKAGGLKEENIIVFMYDDIAYNKENRFPGVIINRPGGENVYPGVPKDYIGDQASSNNFFAVLQGNKSALSGGSGKVVNSGPNDNIFIFYSDHGAPGFIEMPYGDYDLINANQLIGALKAKHAARSYKSMVIYIEACEAGAMFDGILPDNLNIYAVTASNSTEDSYATYCDYHDGPCLGDMFSIAWMEDSDESNRQKKTVKDQYRKVRHRTLHSGEQNVSHVSQYGDMRLRREHLSSYQGINHKHKAPINEFESSSQIALSQYDADLFYFMHKVHIAPESSQEELEAHKELHTEISCRNYVDQSVNKIGKLLFHEKYVSTVMEATRPQGKAIVEDWDRLTELIKAYHKYCGSLSGYGMKYIRVIAEMCNSGIQVDQMIKASREVCQETPRPPCKTL